MIKTNKQKRYKLRPWVKIACGILACGLVLVLIISFVFSGGKIDSILPVEKVATLCIDPGHGGYDGGTIGADGTAEKEINLAIALAIGDYIEENEPRIEVIYTRDSDEISWPEEEVEDLKARVEYASENNADYYLSIHMNSNEDTSLYGYESYIRQDDAFSYDVSRLIAQNLDEAGWEYDRGVVYVEQYPLYVVSQQTIPALLFEAGYMSNYSECHDLSQTQYQNLIAENVAKAYIEMILEDKGIEEESE
ncbi:N-acetylmuramoyl-L-alanine amidase [Faecalicoccus acidiformans]|uniref:N-acetylmuramoyl-L-alanine amidase n=1 Tax=Faecalicoccus acidiformans TaxID=915173 RepID=UPI00320ACA50